MSITGLFGGGGGYEAAPNLAMEDLARASRQDWRRGFRKARPIINWLGRQVNNKERLQNELEHSDKVTDSLISGSDGQIERAYGRHGRQLDPLQRTALDKMIGLQRALSVSTGRNITRAGDRARDDAIVGGLVDLGHGLNSAAYTAFTGAGQSVVDRNTANAQLANSGGGGSDILGTALGVGMNFLI